MGPYLSYNLEVAIYIAILYLVFKLLLAGEKNPSLNRIIILACSLSAFLAPALFPNNLFSLSTQDYSPAEIDIALIPIGIVDTQYSTPFWFYIASAVYFLGVIFIAIATIGQLFSIRKIIKNGRHISGVEYVIVITDQSNISPFSWGKYIILNRQDYNSESDLILSHELGHINHHHTLDLALMQFLCCIQWFNPAIWLLKAELQAVHEYQADNSVIDSGANIKQYQNLLIKKAIGSRFHSLANSLNHNNLKKRFIMMYKVKKRTYSVRALALIPALAAAFGICNIPTMRGAINSLESQSIMIPGADTNSERVQSSGTSTVSISSSNAEKKTPTKGLQSSSSKEDKCKTDCKDTKKCDVPQQSNCEASITIDNPDKIAEFPGGQKALYEFLMGNIKYPAKAQGAGIQGNVIVKFTIDETGVIKNASIIKSVDEELDKEALRVISVMPKWIPAQKDGKSVASSFVIPVMFKMTKEQPKTKNQNSQGNYTIFLDGELFDGNVNTLNASSIKSLDIIKNDPNYPNGKIVITTK